MELHGPLITYFSISLKKLLFHLKTCVEIFRWYSFVTVFKKLRFQRSRFVIFRFDVFQIFQVISWYLGKIRFKLISVGLRRGSSRNGENLRCVFHYGGLLAFVVELSFPKIFYFIK